MNTILNDDERPKLPEAQKYRRQQRHDGGYELVPAYTQEEMEAYADAREAAVLAKLREQEPVKLDHIACIEDGELRYMTGRKAPAHDCELYAMPDGQNAPLLYAAPQPAVVPPGYKLVPVEPGDWVFADKVLGHDSHPNHKERMRRLYRAFLAAAPEAPATIRVQLPQITDAMINAANRNCRNTERCGDGWEPSNCEFCRRDTAEDLKAAFAAAPEAPALPAEVREAIKAARKALHLLLFTADDSPSYDASVTEARAALARLDALGGGE